MLTVPDTHKLKIAYRNMRLVCVGTMVLGGPNHKQAQEIIRDLTGKKVALPADCTCK